MTNIKNLVVLGATVVVAALGNLAIAQDDLDKLLQDLEGKDTPKAETKAAEAPVASTDATEAPKVEAQEEKSVEPVEVKEAAKEEEPAAAAENTAQEEKAEEVATTENEQKAEEATEKKEENKGALAELEEPKKPVSPDDEILVNIVATEQLRRKARDAQASREILQARKCMESEEYTEAVRYYGLAQKLLNDSASTKNLRKECDQGIAEGLYRAALQEERETSLFSKKILLGQSC
jgi:outer membrane biosynthesis protein TonB